MKYSELISFNPIETIIQLKDANDKDKAKSLIESYVMSDEMADKLNNGIINELQFEEVIDNKGVLIVGNYGTGKSHLMSVISSVVYDEENLNYLKNEKFAQHIEKVAGKFEVLRIEIGSVSNSLRNIVVSEIEKDLQSRGISYKFPSADDITNNKASLLEMMAAFEVKYPEKGYLLVIDELLDYLRTRKEHDLMLDLGFLRELGEFIKNSRFRLICGIQEQLFENPAFSFVSKSLNRVKDRFEQVIIRKEDTAYVVSERILGKTTEQKAKIREHLMPFCNLYSEMSERLEDYVELYPIHPSYIEIFSKVYIAEKREVLKTISLTIKRILDEEVSDNAPGIISFDSYWNFIKDNYARKSEAEIKEVMDKSAVLEDKIVRTFPKKAYKPMALQIINAMSVHRLTTSGIDVRIGLTVEDLKDDLCLFIENMPEMDSEFLLSMIQTVIKDVITLVSGQFIESNPDNGQHFLDLKKDIDYDAKIEQKADMLADDELNRFFYKIVYDSLEWDAEQYVPNFEIYEYLLNWETHNVFRRGYLFMGLPKERSTAQPPRDFYIYMLPPYGDADFEDERNNDEVMFEFKGDDQFYHDLRLYAASLSMKALAAEQNTKSIYNKKADGFRKRLLKWLNDNKNTSFNVIFKGIKKQLIEATNGKSRLSNDFKNAVDIASSMCLSEFFNTKYPDFPKFKVKLTQANQAEIIERAIRYFAGQTTKDSALFLESFYLLKDGKIDVDLSKYAMHIVKTISKFPPNSVINRTDLVDEIYDECIDKQFRVNLEYYGVVLLALVYSGHITLTLKDGTVLTASNMEKTAKIGNMDIYDFKYIAKPKQAAIEELKKLFEILDLPTGLVVNPNELQKGLDRILERTGELASKALHAKRNLYDEFNLWGEALIPNHIMNDYENKVSNVIDEFGNFKNKYNTVAKLNNFNLSMERLEELQEGIKCVEIINQYKAFKNKCETIINYISTVETMELPTAISESISNIKPKFIEIRDSLREGNEAENASRSLISELTSIKNSYIDFYFEKHQKARLGVNDAKKKGDLINSKILSNLKKLKDIESIFQTSKLLEVEREISGLQVCYELNTNELQKRPICPHCHFKAFQTSPNIAGKIDEIELRLETLIEKWTTLLIQALEDPLILANKTLLKKDQQKLIEKFVDDKKLPDSIDVFFINTFNLLFSELDKVTINVEEIINEILQLGPCTVEDLKSKLNTFVDQKIAGKDKSKLRLILKNNMSRHLSLIAEDSNKENY